LEDGIFVSEKNKIKTGDTHSWYH